MASPYPAWIKGRRFFVNISDVCPAIWPLSRVFHVKRTNVSRETVFDGDGSFAYGAADDRSAALF